MDDGLLEVVGVTGVVHMVRPGRGRGAEPGAELPVCPQGQVQSGMRAGIRVAQGNYVRLTVRTSVPVQVDGEPWIQPPGHVIVSAAGPKVAPPRWCHVTHPCPAPWLTLWLPCRQVRMLKKSKQKQKKSSAGVKDGRSESPSSRDGGR